MIRLNRDALVAIRELQGLTQSELADRAAIRRDTMSRIESGNRPGTPEQMRALADALGVPMVAILANIGADQ